MNPAIQDAGNHPNGTTRRHHPTESPDGAGLKEETIMKRTLAILLTCAFAFGGLAATGCGDPCEKAVDKTIECFGKDSKELKEKMAKEKKEMVEKCKKSDKDKKKAKECVKESDCKKFLDCLMKEK
jgi:hypothetical protein